MGDAVEKAQQEYARAHGNLQRTQERAVAGLEITLRQALDDMIERVVLGQPELTNGMDAATLATLKFNLVQAVDAAVSGVYGKIADVDLEARSASASLNVTGSTFIKIGPTLSPLIAPVAGVLTKAGYDVYAIRDRSSASGALALADIEKGSDSAVIGRNLDAATEELGKARIVLDAAKHKVAVDQARDAWSNA